MSSNLPPSQDNPHDGTGQQPFQPPQQPYGQGAHQQAPMPAQAVPTAPAPGPGGSVLATPIERFLARLIDFAVLLIPQIVVWSIAIDNGFLLAGALGAAMTVAYDGVLLTQQAGQTIGKRAMKIRVVSAADGTSQPGPVELWTRAGIYGGPLAVPCLGNLFALLNCLWHLWDKPYQQCLHDKTAKTVVVKVAA